jgi:rhodanese-related sulfurtransferase
MPAEVSPAEARAAAAGGARIVDVRERAEWDALRVEHAVLAPLSAFPGAVDGLDKNSRVLTLCTVGARAEDAGRRLAAAGFRDVAVISGGLDAWQAAGLPVIVGKKGGWTIERQVRLIAGLLVSAGAAAGFFVHPAFFGVCALVGAGLTLSGLTNWCGAALILLKMPWNRSAR